MALVKKVGISFLSIVSETDFQDTFAALAPNLGTGKTVYAIVRRDSDSFLMNDADGEFVVAPSADPFLALTEDATIKGFYEASESRTVWTDSQYLFFFYEQTGGSPAPASDKLIGTRNVAAHTDKLVGLDDILTDTVSIETKIDTIDTVVDSILTLLNTVDGKIDIIDTNADDIETLTKELRTRLTNINSQNQRIIADLDDGLNGVARALDSMGDEINRPTLDNAVPTQIGDR